MWTVNGTPIDLLGATATLTLGASGDNCSLRTYTDLNLAMDDQVVVQRDGQIFFSGLVRSWGVDSAAPQLAYALELGSWYRLLEEFVCTQDWPTGADDTPKSKSRVVLCSDGRSTTTELAAVLAQVGGLLGFVVSGLPPFVAPMPMELLDKTVAEAVNDLLRWHPDAILYLDYSTHPPTLRITSRLFGLSPISFHYSGVESARGVAGLFTTLTPTPIEGVVVTYEIRKVVDGAEYWDIAIDTAGATTGRRVVRHTIPLAGANITRIPGQSATIETEDVPDTATSSNVKTWVQRNVPELAEMTVGDTADLEIIALSHSFEAWDPEDGDQPPTAPRALVDGVFYDWMPDFWAAPVTIAVRAQWRGASTRPCAPAFGPTRDRTFYVQITGTNATTGTFTRPGSAEIEPGEPVPTGVAQHIYDSRITAGPAGSAILALDEPDCTLRAGQWLTLHGEVSVTNALVQTLTRDHHGRTTFQCGPAGQLGTPDLYLRQQRSSARSHRYHSDRGEADSSETSGSSIDGPRRLPRARVGSSPQAEEHWAFKCYLDGVAGESKLIRITGGTVYTPTWVGTIDPENPLPITWVNPITVSPTQKTVATGQSIYLKLSHTLTPYTSTGPFPVDAGDLEPPLAGVAGNLWTLDTVDIVIGSTATPPTSTHTEVYIPLADLSGSIITHRHMGDLYWHLPVLPFIPPAWP